MKFMNFVDYQSFVVEYQDYLFENVYGLFFIEENKIKIFGKDFVVWVRGEGEDEFIWVDVEDEFEEKQRVFWEILCEKVKNGVQSFIMGVLDNSFLVGNLGIEVLLNFFEGVYSKGVILIFVNNKSFLY